MAAPSRSSPLPQRTLKLVELRLELRDSYELNLQRGFQFGKHLLVSVDPAQANCGRRVSLISLRIWTRGE
jgi:hypothetical protein